MCGMARRARRSLSVKRKSPTSAWRRSSSSTRRTSKRANPAYNTPAVAAAAEVAEAAPGGAERVELAADAEAAAVAAASRGELANSYASWGHDLPQSDVSINSCVMAGHKRVGRRANVCRPQ